MLFATKSEPDQVNRGASAEEKAAEEEVVVGVEPVIEGETDATPDQET